MVEKWNQEKSSCVIITGVSNTKKIETKRYITLQKISQHWDGNHNDLRKKIECCLDIDEIFRYSCCNTYSHSISWIDICVSNNMLQGGKFAMICPDISFFLEQDILNIPLFRAVCAQFCHFFENHIEFLVPYDFEQSEHIRGKLESDGSVFIKKENFLKTILSLQT